MNAAHLHLMLNHLPVLGAPFVALLLAWGLFRQQRDLVRAGLGAAVILAALAYPVFLTGEPAEHLVEDSAWFDEHRVHEHEERAEAGLIAILITGTVAGFGLWQSRGGRNVNRLFSGATLAGLVLSAGLFGWAALAGGEIRHDEVRAEAATVTPNDGRPDADHD
ncbi:MAG: hypothetical protein SGJ01_13540 [Gemmatimonadota bacterium]|nr:hypothetical protein [Gemmatimonadota bacterium]